MKTVAIPIETKVRELHGKLWLAIHLIENDHKVILGPSDEIHHTIHATKPDVYITKDPGRGNEDLIDQVRNAGCKSCGLSTEGGVFNSIEQYTIKKGRVLDHLDIDFVWGNQQAEALYKMSGREEKIAVTGDPSFDLLSKPYRSMYLDNGEKLQKKYDSYILFNTNFPRANPYNPDRFQKKIIEVYGEYDLNEHIHIKKIFHEFITAIYSLHSKLSDINIIIRPHPSENHNFYKNEFDKYESIYTEHSGNVRNWIAGAEAVVHNSCTTGIESALMETPVIAFQPIQNEKYDKDLPNIVSEQVYNRTDFLERISYYVNNDEPYEMTDDQHQELKRYFHNVDTVAAESITEHIDTLEIPTKQSYSHLKPGLIERIKWRAKASGFSNVAISAYDSINAAFGNTEPAERRGYRRQKFPGLTKREIRTTLQRFETDIRTENIEITSISGVPDTFVLEPE